MEKVINLLYDIEEKANAIVNHTSVEKKALYDQMTKDTMKLDAEKSKETQEKLDVIRTKMNKEIAAEEKTLEESFQQHLAALEDGYKTNHDAFVESVFQKIIGA